MAGKDVSLHWMPVELRPAPQPTLRPEGDYLQPVWNKSVYPLAEALGVPIVLPTISPQPHTRLAFEGYHFAEKHHEGDHYSHTVMSAFFQDQRDISSIDVLSDIAHDLGFNAHNFRRALETGRYRDAHRSALSYASYVRNVTVVPTYVIGEQTLQGLKSQRYLEQTLANELAKT